MIEAAKKFGSFLGKGFYAPLQIWASKSGRPTPSYFCWPDWSPGGRSLDSNASRFNGLDFSSEVGPKSFHQLAHPSDEVGSLHGFEQLRGKVVGLKMKDAIPTPAERLDIRRRQERVDPGINQFQMPEALNYDAQARVPIVHEVTAWAGEKFEGGEIRIL